MLCELHFRIKFSWSRACSSVTDSNVIIRRLRQHFKIGIDSDLSEAEKGAAHMATVALENRTAIAGFYWRYGFNMEEFTDILCKGRMPAKILGFWKRIQPYGTRFKTRQHGLARHTKEEVEEFSCQDIQVGKYSDFAGNDHKGGHRAAKTWS